MAYIIHYGLSNIDILKSVFNSLIDLFDAIYKKSFVENRAIWDALCMVISSTSENQLYDEKARILDVIINGENYKKTIDNIPIPCYRAISNLSMFISSDTQDSLCVAIDGISDDTERVRAASTLINFLPLNKYQPILIDNMDKLNTNRLFDLIRKKSSLTTITLCK